MISNKAVQIINGCQYDVLHNAEAGTTNREVVIVSMLDETIVGILTIDHNTEFVNVTYRIAQGDYTNGTYNYFELPEDRTELAQWIVNTHPNY